MQLDVFFFITCRKLIEVEVFPIQVLQVATSHVHVCLWLQTAFPPLVVRFWRAVVIVFVLMLQKHFLSFFIICFVTEQTEVFCGKSQYSGMTSLSVNTHLVQGHSGLEHIPADTGWDAWYSSKILALHYKACNKMMNSFWLTEDGKNEVCYL